MPRKVSRQEKRFQALRRLENVEIILQNLCLMSWSEMVGDRCVRKCHHCQLNVYNFTAMAPDEILEVIKAHEGKLCAQLYGSTPVARRLNFMTKRGADFLLPCLKNCSNFGQSQPGFGRVDVESGAGDSDDRPPERPFSPELLAGVWRHK